MEDYQEIINTYYNGQNRQLLSHVDSFGWYDFTERLQNDDTLNDSKKLDLLCIIIRAKNR